MFRVFYIFRNPTSRKRVSYIPNNVHISYGLRQLLFEISFVQKVHDWMLALSVVVFITIDVIILLTYTTVEGIRGNLYAELQPNDEDRQAEIGVSLLIRGLVLVSVN